jgi:hypothetical protein
MHDVVEEDAAGVIAGDPVVHLKDLQRFDLDPSLLQHLTLRGLQHRLPQLDPSSREAPVALARIRGALDHQQTAAMMDTGAGC